MEKPHGILASVAASTTTEFPGTVELIRPRTVKVWARCTFNASATAGAVLYVYSSPDGENWDNDPYAELEIPLTAGSAIQSSAYLLTGEHEKIKFAIKNKDASYTITNCKVWYAVQDWGGVNGPAQDAVGVEGCPLNRR